MTTMNPAPIVFMASNPSFVSHFPDGADELWSANLAIYRGEELVQVFEDILFVESQDMAFIYGIEFEDGCPLGLRPDLASKQQAFIAFLRDQTTLLNLEIGVLARVFSGHEYGCEYRATAAYLAIRNKPLSMGIGYRKEDGRYELERVDNAFNQALPLA